MLVTTCTITQTSLAASKLIYSNEAWLAAVLSITVRVLGSRLNDTTNIRLLRVRRAITRIYIQRCATANDTAPWL